MQIIANNISTRKTEIKNLFARMKELGWNPECAAVEMLKDTVRRCVIAGADSIEIDIQQHFDYPEAMALAVSFVQAVTDRPLVLSSNNRSAIEAGLEICKTPPVVNYISDDEMQFVDALRLVVGCKAEVILLVSDPSKPSNLQEMLARTGVLISIANRLGVTDEHIIIDPGLYHITQGYGQQHLANVLDFIEGLATSFSPALRTTCWLSNASAGAPVRLRQIIDGTLLTMLAAKGLSSVFIDVLNKEDMRTVRLLKILQNERVYAESELSLNPVKTQMLHSYGLVRN